MFSIKTIDFPIGQRCIVKRRFCASKTTVAALEKGQFRLSMLKSAGEAPT